MARLASWAPMIWGLPWFVADLLVRWTTLLGPENVGGVKEAHPTPWLVFVAGLGLTFGYKAFADAQSLRVPRGIAAGALMLAFFGGFPFLGGPAWALTSAALFLSVFALEIAGSVLDRRQRRRDVAPPSESLAR